MGIFHGKFGVAFPKESQLQQPRYPTLINYKVLAGSFHVSVIHQTLTSTTRSLTCVRDHSYACVCTQGLCILTTSQRNILTRKNFHKVFLCSWRCSNLRSLDLESNALPIEQPGHPSITLYNVSIILLYTTNVSLSIFTKHCWYGSILYFVAGAQK